MILIRTRHQDKPNLCAWCYALICCAAMCCDLLGVQSMSMTGSVIVTTPHPLAVADVLKGQQMMQSMHVPTLALVRHIH